MKNVLTLASILYTIPKIGSHESPQRSLQQAAVGTSKITHV